MSDPRKLSPSEISIDAIENGKILFAEERLEEAREQYLFAINANPNSDEAYGGLTNIYISMALKEPELKQRQKLFEGLSEQVRKLSPKKDLANRYIECSNLYFAAGLKEKDSIKKRDFFNYSILLLISASKINSHLKKELAEKSYQRGNQIPQSEQTEKTYHYGLTIDFDPEHISAHLELGDIIKHAAAKQANHANKRMLLDASNDYYERALKLNPSSEVANLKLAEGYMSKSEFEKSQNKFKDANLALEKSYQLLKTFLSKNSSPKALQLQGNTLVLQFILLENTPQGPKKLDEAIASLEKAFQLNPTLANIKKELDLAVWKKTGELSDRKFSP